MGWWWWLHNNVNLLNVHQTVHLKMLKMINFMLSIVYHNFFDLTLK